MSPDLRFVFDTNVLVSAFLFRNSIPRHALDHALKAGSVVHSDETMLELWEVMMRPKFDRYLSVYDRQLILTRFEEISASYFTDKKVVICRDPKDDKFFSLALSARATCIVSGDQDLLVLGSTFEVPVLKPIDFLSTIFE